MKRFSAYLSTIIAGCLLTLLAGCGSGGGDGRDTSTTAANQGTGAIAVALDWSAAVTTSAKGVLLAPAGVATMRFIVSSADMAVPVQKDFPAAAGTGTVDGVLAGTGRTVTAQGLDSAGMIIYQGSVANITVVAGQTTNAGTIAMAAATHSVSGSITLNGSGLSGVTVTLSTGAAATTNAGGVYTFTGLANGNYSITPTLAGYVFSPATLSCAITNTDLNGRNFTATRDGSITIWW